MKSIKTESLNKMIFFGEASLRKTIREFMIHYHEERNHQGLENRLIEPHDDVGIESVSSKTGKLQQHKFLLGTDRKDIERRERKLRELWDSFETACEDVLDRFHIMQKFGKAIDQVRSTEVKQLQADGYEPVLTGCRWLLLKRPENCSEKQVVKMQELLQYNLKSLRSTLQPSRHLS